MAEKLHFPFSRSGWYNKKMARLLLLLFSIIIFSIFLWHLSPAKAEGTGMLAVTTTPVGGSIYVDNLFQGVKFWSGNLNVGSHVVSFGHVDGYVTPSPQSVTIIADQTYYLIGAYRKSFSPLKSE
jgi:hypothetical protein